MLWLALLAMVMVIAVVILLLLVGWELTWEREREEWLRRARLEELLEEEAEDAAPD